MYLNLIQYLNWNYLGEHRGQVVEMCILARKVTAASIS